MNTNAEKAKFRAAVLEYMKRDGVSFAELSRHIEGFKGDMEWIADPVRNIVVWSGISQMAFDVLKELRDEGHLHLAPSSAFIYLVDGVVLNFPIAKKARSYKKPHWIPCVLNLGPDPNQPDKI